MTRDEIKKKWKNGELLKTENNQANSQPSKPTNQQPVQPQKSTWSNIMTKIGNTMDYISGGQVQSRFGNREQIGNFNIGVRNQDQKNKSLKEDVRGMGKLVMPSLKRSGLNVINYIEGTTSTGSESYRNIQKKMGEQEYINENKQPLITARNNGREVLSDVSVAPTKEKINKSIDKQDEEIQKITERQNNPVTKTLAELIPSQIQSQVGRAISLVNPVLRNRILSFISIRRLYSRS